MISLAGHSSYTPPLIRNFPSKVLCHYPECRPDRPFNATAITTVRTYVYACVCGVCIIIRMSHESLPLPSLPSCPHVHTPGWNTMEHDCQGSQEIDRHVLCLSYVRTYVLVSLAMRTRVVVIPFKYVRIMASSWEAQHGFLHTSRHNYQIPMHTYVCTYVC